VSERRIKIKDKRPKTKDFNSPLEGGQGDVKDKRTKQPATSI
jgi:hypothetical protein